MPTVSASKARALLRAAPSWLLAGVAFSLAFFSPVEEVQSDPAIALLATQSLLDHQTLYLDDYADDPACAYDLESDYRIRRRGDSLAYYSHGVSVLSLPAVWVANRLGYHMLDQADEFALQNMLSALCCALLGVLLYRICRVYLGPLEGLAVAAVSLFGSSLISNLATGLWNLGYEALLLGLGLLHLTSARPRVAYLALLGGLAFLCRPTAAFAVLAAIPMLVAGLRDRKAAARRRQLWLALTVGLTLLAALLTALDLAGLIPRYYSPLKLTPQSNILTGLHGALLSPSRGLLVFSPFLIPVVAVCLRHLRALAGDPLFRTAAIWSGLQLLAIATKGTWWGGHSYGPRLLAELILPATVVTCLAWRQLRRTARRPARTLLAAGYLAGGLIAIAIHSYQGLFNHHTRRWNWKPDIDRNPHLAFDWRYPQFLATDHSLKERAFELERLAFQPYVLGRELTDQDGAALGALFRDWYPPEPGWRWSRGTSPEILLRLGELVSGDLYRLTLSVGSLGHQRGTLEINGTEIGRFELSGPVEQRAFVFERDLLRPGLDNALRFDLPGATSTATDPRMMGLALHSLELDAVTGGPRVHVDDGAYFVSGFSGSEEAWRWTDGHHAAIDVPVGDVARLDTLELSASALDHQPVSVRLNGTPIGELTFSGGFDDVVTQRLAFDPSLLRSFRMNRIELDLPNAQSTAEDARLLGLAFRRLELRPAP